jgi:hypothetical protein
MVPTGQQAPIKFFSPLSRECTVHFDPPGGEGKGEGGREGEWKTALRSPQGFERALDRSMLMPLNPGNSTRLLCEVLNHHKLRKNLNFDFESIILFSVSGFVAVIMQVQCKFVQGFEASNRAAKVYKYACPSPSLQPFQSMTQTVS